MDCLLTECQQNKYCYLSIRWNSDMEMKYLILVTMLSISTTALAKRELPVNRYNCENVEYKIDVVKERQRKGYSTKEGEKLRAKLKELKELDRNCKKQKNPTK
jgi:hypothetical protein